MKKTIKEPVKNSYGIFIGIPKESIAEIRGAINDILKSGADQTTLVVALEVLKTATSVTSNPISNCSFTGI